ncbi:MAG TPA: oligopeptide transporter, OPT family [Candidatus Binatia bacterium]|nr:oligopeptide transporter, OPT family [Candidatus Binatia bacterium]
MPDRFPLVPYVRSERNVAELTVRSVLLGAVLSLTFGMVNSYLALKIGLTVSASIPSAVLSMALLRGVLRRGTILENNIVHTIASAGESLAAGVVFTVPALIFLDLAPSGFEIFLLGASAGMLGILMMIPLRDTLVVKRHGELPFPEGTACAMVLIAGDKGGTSARPVFGGIVAGALYTLLGRGLRLWNDTVFWSVASLHKASIGFELSPMFLGVGYLIGPRIASVMLAGGLIGWTALIPFFDVLGDRAVSFGLPAGIGGLDAREIWRQAVRYVGAGAVAAGGMVSLVRALPAMRAAVVSLLLSLDGSAASGARTDRDLPGVVVLGGVGVLALGLWLLPWFHMRLSDALLAVSFTFFFVVVSSEIVGLIGTTSQPVSGMTITALLVTALAILLSGRTGAEGAAAAIRVAAIVAVSIALAGDMSQDLKTGALVGATPWMLQVGEIVGTAVAALRAGWVLFLLHKAYGIGSAALPAPQAKLMATLAAGVMQGDLPWRLLALGAGLALAVEAFGVASLPFAIGLYLPITTSASLVLGGIASWLLHGPRAVDERAAAEPGEADRNRRESLTLLASGLVAGDALMGIGVAALVVSGLADRLALRAPGSGAGEDVAAILPFLLLFVLFARFGRRMISIARPSR